MIDIDALKQDKRPQSSTIVHALIDRLDAAEADALEQARLNGMGAERELALMAKLEAAEKERDALLEALKEIMPFTATIAIGCRGDKCREPWCYSCNGEEEAEEAAQKGCDAYAKARAAIARATGEQP